MQTLHPIAQLVATLPAPTLPEAACSVNAHVDVDGLRIQVTGRGQTGEEAAANFRATLAAMQPAPAAEVIPTLAERVGTLLACWLAKAAERQDWTLVDKLSKGAALVLAGKVAAGNREGCIAVWSASHDGYYEVDGKQCTCPDYEQHVKRGVGDHVCKHVAAAALWQRLG